MGLFTIQSNLQLFRVQDFSAIATHRGTVLTPSNPVQVSALAAFSRELRTEADKIDNVGPQDFTLRLARPALTGGESEYIGHIDSDSRFYFRAAPDLRTCLAWAVATDLGQTRVLDGYDLEADVERLSNAIRRAPFGQADEMIEAYFFDTWMEREVQEVYGYQRSSQFSGGYCTAAARLWQVGTRTLLGNEHPGFSFVH